MNKPERTTMSVREMGQMFGLCKTESYWLVHKQCFETTLVQGIMRVNIESFEHWYANQIKYKKIDGTPPGEELRSYSYAVQEMADLLGVSDDVVYALLKRDHIETFEVDTWMRIRKDVFEKWYKSQTKYRTKEDRERDAELESSSITLPQMARMLGITRDEVYAIIGKKRNQDVFDIIVVADKKRVTLDSFEAWYQSQERYQKVMQKTSGLKRELPKCTDKKYKKTATFVSPETVRRIHKLLHSCFEQAIRWDLMIRNPAQYATVPKSTRKQRDIWTAETLMKAVELCDDPKLKLAI